MKTDELQLRHFILFFHDSDFFPTQPEFKNKESRNFLRRVDDNDQLSI